jgi:HK97 family phage prohead protease
MSIDHLNLGREARIASGFEIRRVDDNEYLAEFRGYASVTGHAYEVAGGPEAGGWIETIAPGAFKRTLGQNQNRALLYHHDNSKVLATTRTGALTMTEDGVGLLVEARLDTRVNWIADIVRQVEAGTVDEMSIGFYARGSQWSKDYLERTIDEVQLVEATITWAGANGATVAAIERCRDLVTEARTVATTRSLKTAAIAAAAANAALSLR